MQSEVKQMFLLLAVCVQSGMHSHKHKLITFSLFYFKLISHIDM